MMDKELVLKKIESYLKKWGKMTLRQVFYRLVSDHLIENNIGKYKWLSRFLVQEREKDDWLAGQILDRARPRLFYFKSDLWEGQGRYLEVWVEKDALRSFFEPIAKKYAVNLVISRGYPSWTIVRELKDRLPKGVEVKILYFGDFDPSGEDIFRHINEELKEEKGEVIKCALTLKQVQEHNLPPMMCKSTDTRTKGFSDKYGMVSAVELDALPPDILKNIIKESILKYLSPEARAKVLLEKKRLEYAGTEARIFYSPLMLLTHELENSLVQEALKHIQYTDIDLKEATQDVIAGKAVSFTYDSKTVHDRLAPIFKGQLDRIFERIKELRGG